MDYLDIVARKRYQANSVGFDPESLNENLKDFQIDIVRLALRRGRFAIFADTGLGKTLMQLAWAYEVVEHTDKPVIVLAPLCVAQQTVREGKKFGIDSDYIREPKFTNSRIHVINYEMLKNFNPSNYGGIVIDESSILKGMDGKLRKQITDFAKRIDFRLSCTATPSPNDFMELGTQSEFLGVMSQVEMLATFFIHDGSDTSKWRLKGHARKKFWEWLSTWSIVIRNPSDYGYDSSGYDLPDLVMHEHVIETDATDGLFVDIAMGLQDRNKARRESVDVRCEKAAEIMNGFDCGIAWCNLNDESQMIAQLSESVEITGSMDNNKKEAALIGFADGEIKKIVTKPKIAGFGLNWQHCNKMVFVGLSDSFEAFYQSVRRCWRFGQTKPVNVHVVISDREGAVLENIKRKQKQHDEMTKEMVSIMREFTKKELEGVIHRPTEYKPKLTIIKPKF